MNEILNLLQKKQQELESKIVNNDVKISDIQYYGQIEIEDLKEPVYVVDKKADGKISKELYLGNEHIADINESGEIQIGKEYEIKIDSVKLLLTLKEIKPISLRKLEALRERGYEFEDDESNISNEKDRKVDEPEEDHDKDKTKESKDKVGTNKAKTSNKDIIIDMDKRITETKRFADLVPEVREKGIKEVRVRRKTMTEFEFYGINDAGEEVKIESLKRTEGISPNKMINQVNKDGTEVTKVQVLTMLKIEHGGNEQNSNEGFTVTLGDLGIPEVAYYRRAKSADLSLDDSSLYTSVPVNLENTNQKRTEKNVREFAERKINTRVDDNVEKANEILEDDKQEKTSLKNIDDNPYNDEANKMEDYIENLKEEACKRCKISREGLEKAINAVKGKDDTIEQQIEKAEELIIEQSRGNRNL